MTPEVVGSYPMLTASNRKFILTWFYNYYALLLPLEIDVMIVDSEALFTFLII